MYALQPSRNHRAASSPPSSSLLSASARSSREGDRSSRDRRPRATRAKRTSSFTGENSLSSVSRAALTFSTQRLCLRRAGCTDRSVNALIFSFFGRIPLYISIHGVKETRRLSRDSVALIKSKRKIVQYGNVLLRNYTIIFNVYVYIHIFYRRNEYFWNQNLYIKKRPKARDEWTTFLRAVFI